MQTLEDQIRKSLTFYPMIMAVSAHQYKSDLAYKQHFPEISCRVYSESGTWDMSKQNIYYMLEVRIKDTFKCKFDDSIWNTTTSLEFTDENVDINVLTNSVEKWSSIKERGSYIRRINNEQELFQSFRDLIEAIKGNKIKSFKDFYKD